MKTLDAFLKEYPKVALAFSGGADSSYLLYAAKSAGCRVQPYFVKSQFQPAFELADARRLCEELSVPLQVLDFDLSSCPEVLKNPKDRCYHCKRALFSALLQAAQKDGYTTLFDGSNASDDSGDRPGMRAAAELKVVSPLRACGITKTKLRALSKEAGLFTHQKPAYACLATRIPTGMPITSQQLAAVEAGEGILHQMGFTDLRLRVDGRNGELARLELPLSDWEQLLLKRETLLEAMRPYFSKVVLDLVPRSGKEG